MSMAWTARGRGRAAWSIAVALGVACGDDGGGGAGSSGGSEGATTTGGAGQTDTTAAVDSTGAPESSSDDSSSGGPPQGCWDDLPVGSSEALYEGFTGGSEGIAFGADGRLYVTTSEAGVGTVWQLDAAGVPTEFASVPYALGLAPLGDGFVVASIGESSMPDGAVYHVDAAGTATSIATGIDSPNFVTITPEGTALVSDDFDTRVFRVTLDGTVDVVIADVPSPNGMAYSPAGDVLYVASTFTAEGQLTRYDVDGSGLPIEASAIEIMQLGPGSTPDGIAVDEDGFVYVAANLLGEIWRVDGSVTELTDGELVAEGLGTPASLAFGRGPGFDPCSLYVTQLFGDQVLRVVVGREGAPLYQ